jgi:multiple sugar transport system substrate-binding protein
VQFIRWLYHNDGKLISDDGKKVAFNDRAGLETLEWLQRVVSAQGPFDVTRGLAGLRPFYAGKLAMTVQQDNVGSGLRTDAEGKNLEWGISLLPVNERNSKAKAQTPALAGHGYGVPRDAKNPEGGWALTKFLTTGPAACGFITKDQGRFAPLKQCGEIPEAKATPEYKVFAEGGQAGIAVPITSANANIAVILSTHVLSVFEGKASPSAALEAAAREAQVELDKAVVLVG